MNQKTFPIFFFWGGGGEMAKFQQKHRQAQKSILSRRFGELHWSGRFVHCLEDSRIKMFEVIGNIHLVTLGENISEQMQVFNLLRFSFICKTLY